MPRWQNPASEQGSVRGKLARSTRVLARRTNLPCIAGGRVAELADVPAGRQARMLQETNHGNSLRDK
jgi:hypothetical protein